MKEELYVITSDGKRLQLDLPNPSGITLKWVSNLFNDLSKLTCSYSYTFKLPMTRNNRVVFDQVEDIRHKSEYAGKKTAAEFILNGLPICKNANLYISEVGNSSYSCVMTWGVLKAFQTLKESSLKLNELTNVGNIYWNDDSADDILYGELSRELSNTDNVVYPDYDAGCPHYDGTPPKPCIPIYRVIQLINEKYGVKFDIGRELSKDLGIMPFADFNNPNYHKEYVYDDYVTHGVLPLVNTVIDGTSQIVSNLVQISSFTMKTLDQSGTRSWRFAVARIRNNGQEIIYRSLLGLGTGEIGSGEKLPTAKEIIVGIPVFRDFEGSETIKPLYAESYESIGDEVKGRGFVDQSYYDYWRKNDIKFSFASHEFNYHDVAYTRLSAIGASPSMSKNYVKKFSNCIGFVCNYAIDLYGSLKLHVSKEAVDEGRVSLDEYRWITLALIKSSANMEEASKEENQYKDRFEWSGEHRLAEWETVSEKDIDRWLGLQSMSSFVYDEASDSYVYIFDFGVEYPVRRLQIDEVEVGEGQVGGYFFIPYWPEDEMQTITETDENGNEKTREELRIKEGDIYVSDMLIKSIEPAVKFYGFPALMNITQNLPNITCFDFMKAVFYMNGAMPKVADDGETIIPMYYNQLRDRVYHGIAKDWSDKLVGGNNKQSDKINFSSSSFAQKNYYEMDFSEREKTDEELADELDVFDTGYGCIDIDNATLNDETSIYKAPFYPGIEQDRQYPQTIVGRTTKIWNGNKVFTTEAKPVYGIMVYRALNDMFEDTSNPSMRHMQSKYGAECKQMRMDVFNPFKDMSEVFGYLRSILQNYVLVKESLRLTEFDVVNLDMSIPIYLSKYNAFFAISTLQRDSKGNYTAELVKLPFVKPEYADVEDDLTSELPNPPDEDVTTWEFISNILSFELNTNVSWSSNLISYDYYINRQYEIRETNSNKLSIPVNGYTPRFVSPYALSVNGIGYTMRYYIPNTVTYRVKTTNGSKTLDSYTKTVKLRVYLDDVLLASGWNEFNIAQGDDGKHNIFKLMFDVVDKEGNVLEEYRKKLYYFAYNIDTSIIDDEFGDDHKYDDKIPVSTCSISGDLRIDNGLPRQYKLTFGPAYANVPVSSVEISANIGKDVLTITDVSLSGFTLQALQLSEEETEVVLTVKVILSDGSSFTTTYEVILSKPVLQIAGQDSFDAANGSGSATYTISLKPYSPIASIKSITSSNSTIRAEKQSDTKFTLSVEGLTEDITSTITVVAVSGGMEFTGTKYISVKYKNTWLSSTLDAAGVLIVDRNGMFYNETEWNASGILNDDADGIAVSDGTHRFMIAKQEIVARKLMDKILVSGQTIAENTAEANGDFHGKENTDAMIAAVSDSAAHEVRRTNSFPSGAPGYIGSAGEWQLVQNNRTMIQKLLEAIGAAKIDFTSAYSEYWTSTQYDKEFGWSYLFHGENTPFTTSKDKVDNIRPFAKLHQIDKPVVRGKIEITGSSSLNTKNGNGSAEYGLSFSPVGISISELSVTSSDNFFVISEVTEKGFTVSVTGAEIDRYATITAKARLNGLIETATIDITAIGSHTFPFMRLDTEKALIVDTEMNLYTEAEWYAANKWFADAEGIAISDGTHRFIMAKEDTDTAQFGGYGGDIIPGVDTTGNGYDGETYTNLIVEKFGASDAYGNAYKYAAIMAKNADAFPSGEKGYLGSAGEWKIVESNYDLVNSLLYAIGCDKLPVVMDGWWTSALYGSDAKRAYSWGKIGHTRGYPKNYPLRVRVFRKIN